MAETTGKKREGKHSVSTARERQPRKAGALRKPLVSSARGVKTPKTANPYSATNRPQITGRRAREPIYETAPEARARTRKKAAEEAKPAMRARTRRLAEEIAPAMQAPARKTAASSAKRSRKPAEKASRVAKPPSKTRTARKVARGNTTVTANSPAPAVVETPNTVKIREAIARGDTRFLLNVLYAGSEYARYDRIFCSEQQGVEYTVEEARVALHALMEWEGQQPGELASVFSRWSDYMHTPVSSALFDELFAWMTSRMGWDKLDRIIAPARAEPAPLEHRIEELALRPEVLHPRTEPARVEQRVTPAPVQAVLQPPRATVEPVQAEQRIPAQPVRAPAQPPREVEEPIHAPIEPARVADVAIVEERRFAAAPLAEPVERSTPARAEVLERIRALASSSNSEDQRLIIEIARESNSLGEARAAVEAVFALGQERLLHGLYSDACRRGGLSQFKEEIVERANALKMQQIQRATRDDVKNLLRFVQYDFEPPFNASRDARRLYSFATAKAAVDRVMEFCGASSKLVFKELEDDRIWKDQEFKAYIQARTHALMFEGLVPPEREIVSSNGVEQRRVVLPVDAVTGRVELKEWSKLEFRPGEVYTMGAKELGHGAMTRVWLGEAREPHRLVAVKNLRVIKDENDGLGDAVIRLNTGFLVQEVRNLHALAAAFEREPAENFPGGVKRNYFPVSYSGVRAAQQGVLLNEFCLGPTEGKHAASLPPEERVPLALQVLHALAIGEGVGVLKTDIKSDPVQALVVDGTAKVLDWNVTRNVPDSKAKKRRVSREIVNEWLLASEKMLRGQERGDGSKDDCFVFHKERGRDDASIVRTIQARQEWSDLFKVMVSEAVFEGKFSTAREAYQRFLELSRNPSLIDASGFEEKTRRFNDGYEARLRERHQERAEELLALSEKYGDRLLTREQIEKSHVDHCQNAAEYAGKYSDVGERARDYGEKINPETGKTVNEGLCELLKGEFEGLTLAEAQRALPQLRKDVKQHGEIPGVDVIGILLEVFPELK